eukprot:gene8055-9602_t
MVDYGLIFLAIFDFLALLVSFFALCIVCDEHLVPAVEVFIVQFQVPEEVAAVTLVAFGSAAPELFLNSVSAVTKTSDLSLAAILGSGIIAFGLIPPLCIINAPQSKIKLKLFPIMRECGFYLLGLFVFLGSIQDSQLASFEAIIIVGVYICYTGVVAAMYFRNKAASDLANSNINNINNSNGVLSPASSPRSPTRRINNNTIHNEFNMDEDLDEHDALLSNNNTSALPTDVASPVRKHNQVPIQTMQNTIHMENSPGKFAFFPTLSRSSSTDLTRNRKGKVAVSGTVSSGVRSSDSSTRMSELVRSVELTDLRSNSPTTVSLSRSAISSKSNSTMGNESGEYSDNDIESAGLLLVDDIQNVDVNTDTSNVDAHSAKHILSFLISGIYVPVEHVLRALLPALHPQIPHFIAGNHATSAQRNPAVASTRVSLLRAVLVLLSSILAIGVLAVCIVLFCQSVIKRLGFDSTTMGATLVALGAEIPDTVSAVAMARNGYYDGAIAGAIGSQVINVSLGVGVPALLVGLFGDGYLHIKHAQADSLELLTCLLIMVILSYIMVTIPLSTMLTQGKWSKYTIVTKPGAVFQICVWLCTYIVFMHLNAD